MDELKRLCVQELMEDLINTASSSDEDDEGEQNIDVLRFLCAQNLIDDLMDSSSSSSSDEDDGFFAVLGYTHLLEEAENLRKCNTVAAKIDHQQGNRNVKDGDTFLINETNQMRKENATVTELRKTTNEAKAINFENRIPNLTAKQCDYPLLKELLRNTNYETREKGNENVLKSVTESDLKRKRNDSEMSACNLQAPLDEAMIDSLSEKAFKQHFHISRETLSYLVERFSLWYCKGSSEQNGQLSNMKTIILTFLWFCANPVSMESVVQMFKVSFMDSKQHLNIILDFFEKELASEIIRLPTSYIDKENIAKDFEKIDGFPNVLGCLAVSCFSLKMSELVEMCDGKQLYLRGICDSNRKFLFVNIAFSEGSKNNMFLEKGLPKLCFPKYHLLGDATCLIRDHLVIPYENTENLNESEKYFNTKLCRTHVKIKEAFDHTRNRFRQLQYLDFNNIETVSKFITACCILHNICIDKQDVYEATCVDNESYRLFGSPPPSAQNDDFLRDLGLMKRCELTEVLFRTRK